MEGLHQDEDEPDYHDLDLCEQEWVELQQAAGKGQLVDDCIADHHIQQEKKQEDLKRDHCVQQEQEQKQEQEQGQEELKRFPGAGCGACRGNPKLIGAIHP